MSEAAERMVDAIGEAGIEEEAVIEEGADEAIAAQLAQLSPEQTMTFAEQAAMRLGPDETRSIISGLAAPEAGMGAEEYAPEGI